MHRPENPAVKFCPHCGARVEKGYQFCAQCGQSLSTPPEAVPASAQVQVHGRHVKLLAVALIVWGSLGLLASLGVLFSLGPLSVILSHIGGSALPLPFLQSLIASLMWVMVALSGATVAAGVGLLDYKPWARWLAIGVCILALWRFPLGTVVGIYGLWVLLSAAGERHYQQEAATRAW